MIWTLLITAILITTLLIYLYNTKNKYQNPDYLNYLNQIYLFFDSISNFDDYITWVKRDEIKNQFSLVGRFFKNKSKYYKNESNVKEFNEIFNDFDNYIENYNKNYIIKQKQLLQDYFGNIEGKSLDEQQRNALITDEYSNLIVAGAGSGKTLTIIGKVKYLIEQKQIKPDEILLLSFTKKTVDELNVRLKNIGLNAKATTFHKLGYDIIKKHQSISPAVTNDNTLRKVIKQYIDEDIFNDTNALEAYVTYLACYMNIPEENDNFDSLGEKIDVEKGIDFQTLKSKCESDELNKISKAKLDTIQGEKVKSTEELTIANFLFLNGINYEYEKPYPYGDNIYRPDFYLTDYDLYLEHFGVDENSRANWLTPLNEEKYIEEMEIKRQKHKENNTKLLETYSYYNRDKILLDKLREMLENENVIFKPRDIKSIYSKVASNDKNFGKEITKLIETFINLSKSRKLNYEDISAIFTDRNKTRNKFMLERQEMFLKFALQVLKRYDNKLNEICEIDFNDMINQSTDLVKINKPDFNYRYIIIDEYQDISFSRFKLIKEIRDLTKARLVCVGDDWQSIYRFAGSDISLFSNFEKYVGKYELLFIENTYRNSQELIDISSRYIKKNKAQIDKAPKSIKESLDNPIKLVYYSNEDAEQVLINEIQTLINLYGNKSILILGRHGFDINDFIKKTKDSKILYNERNDKIEIKGLEGYEIKYITVHKSKGLEADNTIILNLRNHILGFPNKMNDDPMLSLLLSDYEEYRFAEERRLFYVALTRTKNKVILMLPIDASLFAEEIIIDNNLIFSTNNDKLSKTKCPYCKTGHLLIRQQSASNNQFLGCSNYPICNQTYSNIDILENSILCSGCNSGFMVKRKGQFSTFLGCTNYPKCNKKINLQ